MLAIYRSSRREVFCVLRNFAKFNCNFIKKETLAQVFSCEFCEISMNTFSTEHLQTTASGFISIILTQKLRKNLKKNKIYVNY